MCGNSSSEPPVKYYSDDDLVDSDDDEAYNYRIYGEECDSDCELDIKKIKYLVEAIMCDDLPDFVVKLKSLFDDFDDDDDDFQGYLEPILCPNFVTYFIVCYRALKCGTALLQGQTCVVSAVDLNVTFKAGTSPLYFAASYLDYDMVDLLLSHGARADISITIEECNSLPLNAALEWLNNHLYLYDWTPEESIYKLVIILCLPQMKVALETNRLLASSTKDVMEIFVDYAKEGRLIEMAVLLLVANERLMAPRRLQNKEGVFVEGGMSIHDIIMGDILSQSDEEREVSVCNGEKRSKLEQMFKANRAVFTLILLKIFERTGDAIRSYLRSQHRQEPKERVVKEIASILKKAGFVLKEKDIDLIDIDCENDMVKECSGTSETENITEYKSTTYLHMVPYADPPRMKYGNAKLVVKDFASILKEEGFVLKDKDIHLRNKDCESDEIKEFAGTLTCKADNYYKHHDPFNHKFLNAKYDSMGLPQKRQVNQGKAFSPAMLFSSRHCFRLFNSYAVCQLQKNQFKREKNAMQRLISPLKSSNLLATLALSFKRGLRPV